MTKALNNRKTPYLVIWKQILLCIFTLGIWNFTWTNRIMFFINKLKGEKKDTETKTLLNMFVPFYATYWAYNLADDLSEGKTKNGKNPFKVIFTAIQAVACTVSLLLLVQIILTLRVMFTVENSGLFVTFLLLIVGIIFVPGMIQLSFFIIAQNTINELAEKKGIKNSVAYSERSVGSPYCSKVKFVLTNVFTLGLWFFFGWIGKTTAFLNRVGNDETRRTKGDEVLLSLLVPGYVFYWMYETSRLVDAFSKKKQNEEEIDYANGTNSIIGCYFTAWKVALLVLPILVFGIIFSVTGLLAIKRTLYVFLAVLGAAIVSEIVCMWIGALRIQKQINNDVYLRNVESEGILEIRNLRKCFPLKKTVFGTVTSELSAVSDVSFVLKQGETLGIVGESGCGKTTMGRTILKLYPSEEGEIIFNGQDITFCPDFQTRKIRTDMQIIFQDPYSSLPPRSTVGNILSEPVLVHNIVPKDEAKKYVLDLMEKCGLRDYYYERYPHEFSGGQRQRICIARALSVKPKLVICDEPVSALDVSIQAQVINLLKDLQKSMGLTYLFISHDLSVVKFISDKIGVMYLGVMMEFGNKKDIFDNPLHPYTQALFSAIPNPNPDEKSEKITLQGDIPSPANPPRGCRFHTRCPYATERCKSDVPVYREYEPEHFAACHLLEEKYGVK